MDLKTLLGQAGRVLNFVGFALLATVLLFVFTLVLFKCFFAENYEATVDCLESRCSILVACISCLHLATWHPRIDVETLKYATESFKEENIIGQGKRSTVYKGYLAESFLSCGEKIVAVKRIERNSNEVKNIMKECRVLRQMNNQNVVKVLDWRQTGEEIFIVMDFFVNGDLETYLYTADTVIGLEMLLCLQIAIDVAKGIACLHNEWWNERIVHCNLHCSHVLLDQNLNAHISGLRYMKRSNLEKFQFEETEGGSIAPECLTGHLLCKEAEVYSYGIFLLELITRKKPMGSGLAMDKNLCAWVQERFPAKGIEVANAHLLSTTYNPENLLSFIYLALSCVEQSQDTRPNMNKVVITLQQLKNAEMEAMSIQSAYGNNSIQETN